MHEQVHIIFTVNISYKSNSVNLIFASKATNLVLKYLDSINKTKSRLSYIK